MTQVLVRYLVVGLTILSLAAPAMTAEDGSEANPLKSRGPVGKWVTNGKWAMRVTKVEVAESFEAFQKLPWTKRLTEKTRGEVFPAVQGLYERDAKLALVTVEAKNLAAEKRSIGVKWPNWEIRTDDGVQMQFGITPDRALSKSGAAYADTEMMKRIAFPLKGGMPQDELVNANAKTGGVIPMLLPSYADPALFYFRWSAGVGPRTAAGGRTRASSST